MIFSIEYGIDVLRYKRLLYCIIFAIQTSTIDLQTKFSATHIIDYADALLLGQERKVVQISQ